MGCTRGGGRCSLGPESGSFTEERRLVLILNMEKFCFLQMGFQAGKQPVHGGGVWGSWCWRGEAEQGWVGWVGWGPLLVIGE